MAYGTKYRIQFTNELYNEIVILYQKKDYVEDEVQDYAATDVKLTYAGDESKFNVIHGLSLTASFDMRVTDIDFWEEFMNAENDEWYTTATIDGVPLFDGFVLPDEGQVPFQDRPYDATITSVDGLSLLKDVPLRYDATNNFDGNNKLIRYLAFALKQTGLTLPIMVFDNVFHVSMQNRDVDYKNDMFDQAYLEYRTFLSDAITFVSCYDAIELILKDTHRLHYWKGSWVITRISMMQFTPYQSYYTVYDYNGLNPVGHEYLEDYGTVGKNELIYPINEDQLKSVRKSNRSTKTFFNYVPWPEIPKNNKFERGTLLTQGKAFDDEDIDGDGNTTEEIGTYKTYTLDDWVYGTYSGFPSQNSVLPALTPTSATAYRKSVENEFGIEILREIVLEEVPTGIRGVLTSEGIPVIKGDKVSISFDRRVSFSSNGTSQIAMIFLIGDSGTKYFIESQNTSAMTPFTWKITGGGTLISRFYETTENVNQFTNINITPPDIPEGGKLYIGLITTGTIGSKTYFKNIQITYKPYVAGGYVEVKGDYWIQEQSKNLPDKSEEEVFISDNPHAIFKGTLCNSAGEPFKPDWYRMGMSEHRHYKEITNLGKFNLEYRRFWFVEGSFTGTLFAPSNDQENQQPIGLHKQYRLVDIPGDDRRFIITAPLEIDLISGNITARFSEVSLYNPVVQSRTESVPHLIQRIRDNIDNTTEAQWNSAAGAPAPGTAGFPPRTFVGGFFLGDSTDSFGVLINQSNNMTASAVDIGGFNTPTITKYYDFAFTGTDGHAYRILLFRVGPSLHTGNVFTLSAYGHNVATSVQLVPFVQVSDGLQFGDSKNEFKYIF